MILTCRTQRPAQLTHTVTVNIDGDETKRPILVGSFPELGGWNPNEGLQTTWTGEHWS